MTTIAKVLINSKQAEAAETTQYTSTNCTTMIDKFTAHNPTGATQTLIVKLVPSGGAAGISNIVIPVSILAGKTYPFPELVGHSLDPGDFISTLPSAAASVNIRCSGRQIT